MCTDSSGSPSGSTRQGAFESLWFESWALRTTAGFVGRRPPPGRCNALNGLAEVFDAAGAFFMKRSPQHDAARHIADALQAAGIPFAVAGAMVINAHGHRRTTEDVDLQLTREGLAALKALWTFPGSKGMRDTERMSGSMC
jgi:monoamine oxidase